MFVAIRLHDFSVQQPLNLQKHQFNFSDTLVFKVSHLNFECFCRNAVLGKQTVAVALSVLCLATGIFTLPGFENVRWSPTYVDI